MESRALNTVKVTIVEPGQSEALSEDETNALAGESAPAPAGQSAPDSMADVESALVYKRVVSKKSISADANDAPHESSWGSVRASVDNGDHKKSVASELSMKAIAQIALQFQDMRIEGMAKDHRKSVATAANARADSDHGKKKFSSVSELDSHHERLEVSSVARRDNKYFRNAFCGLFCLPLILAVWYSAALFFPMGAHEHLNALLWTPGVLTADSNGTSTVCPKATLCSVGWGEILLLMLSRMTAFALYVSMVITFVAKSHAMAHFLSATYVTHLIPMEYLHEAHKRQGALFCSFALLHTIGHLIRWGVRDEWAFVTSQPGLSGLVAMCLMLVIVLPMAVPAIKKRLSFETRLALHWLFIPMGLTLCWHSTRTAIITLVVLSWWAALASPTAISLSLSLSLSRAHNPSLQIAGPLQSWTPIDC